MGVLEGKVAVITGAGRGIGRNHALLMAKEGAKVVVNDLGGGRDGGGNSSSPADEVVAEIKSLGGQAVANYNSVADPKGAEQIIQTAIDHFGKIDILVNNAGILRDKTILKMEDDQWNIVMDVHLKGSFLCLRSAAHKMKDQGTGGRIINTSFYSGLIGNFGQSNYGAAKAGIYGLTRVAALELGKYGITVNAIAPVAKTRLTEDLPMMSGVQDELDPSFISPVVVYLASDLAANINGKIVGIAGGRISEYKMEEIDLATKDTKAEGNWTPQEIHAKIGNRLVS